MRNRIVFVALFVIGAGVMFLFDNAFTLTLGMLLQAAAVVFGLFTILTPEFLSGDADD